MFIPWPWRRNDTCDITSFMFFMLFWSHFGDLVLTKLPSLKHFIWKCYIDFVYKFFPILCSHGLPMILPMLILHISSSSSPIWHASRASCQPKIFHEVEVAWTPHWQLILNLRKKKNLMPPKNSPWMNLATFHPFSTSKQVWYEKSKRKYMTWENNRPNYCVLM